MANNLRIIYNNLAESLSYSTNTVATGTGMTLTCSSAASAATAASNLGVNAKSRVWRSATSSTTSVQVKMVLSVPTSIIGGIILPFCNLTSASTIRVRGYTGAAPTLGGTVDAPTANATGVLVFDTGTIAAAPAQPLGGWGWGSQPLGSNGYSYGGGTYGRAWVPVQSACTSLLIEIADTNPSQYIEVSRLVVGAYWSPQYNTEYGLSVTQADTSVHTRTESGDLVTNRGISYRTMNFNLSWLPPADRLRMLEIVRGNGLARPIFISLFPNNSDDYDKEQAHQIYGKLSQLGSINHPMFDTYSTSIDIEEI